MPKFDQKSHSACMYCMRALHASTPSHSSKPTSSLFPLKTPITNFSLDLYPSFMWRVAQSKRFPFDFFGLWSFLDPFLGLKPCQLPAVLYPSQKRAKRWIKRLSPHPPLMTVHPTLMTVHGPLNPLNYLKFFSKLDKVKIYVVFSKKMYRFRWPKVAHLENFQPQNFKSGPGLQTVEAMLAPRRRQLVLYAPWIETGSFEANWWSLGAHMASTVCNSKALGFNLSPPIVDHLSFWSKVAVQVSK